ncbi:MAG: hypothetical protein WA549_07520 [Thermoplasmata archaeon]
MSSPPAGSFETSLIILVIIVLVLARRTYNMVQGAAYSEPRLVAFGIFTLVFFEAFAATTLYVAIGVWGSIAWALLAPYVLVVVGAAWLTAPHVRQVVRFERREGDQLYCRLPWVIPVLYLVLFVTRLGIEVVLFGISSLFTFTLPTSLPVVLLAILIGFDLLYGASLGLLFGRGIGVRRAHQDLGSSEGSPALPPEGRPLA